MKYINFVRLKGINCNLCPMRTDEDAIVCYLKWLNDAEIAFYLGSNVKMYSWIEEEKYLKEDSNDTYRFNIVTGDGDPSPDRLIGNCDIRIINGTRNAVFGICIGEKQYWSKGLGTEVMALMVKFCFEELNLHHLTLTTSSLNERAQKCYSKAGFTKCGVEHETTWSQGNWSDTIHMEILATDYFDKLRYNDIYAKLNTSSNHSL